MSNQPLVVTRGDLQVILGKASKRSTYAVTSAPSFPKPVNGLGGREVYWRRADVEAWVAALPTMTEDEIKALDGILSTARAAKKGGAE